MKIDILWSGNSLANGISDKTSVVLGAHGENTVCSRKWNEILVASTM